MVATTDDSSDRALAFTAATYPFALWAPAVIDTPAPAADTVCRDIIVAITPDSCVQRAELALLHRRTCVSATYQLPSVAVAVAAGCFALPTLV